jgi:HEAT repeat protein
MNRPLAAGAAVLLILAATAHAQDEKRKDAGVQPDGLKNLRHPDANVRYRTAAMLMEQGPLAKFAVEELRAAIADTDPLVRVKVAEAIWMVERPSPSAILPTLQRAIKDPSADVRAAACAVVGLMGSKGKGAIPALLATLNDKDLSVVIAAVTALGDIGPAASESAGALLELAGYPDFIILEPVVGAALGGMGEAVVPALTTALKDPSIERRRVAAYALGAIGPDARSAVAALERLLRDEQETLRFLGARALGSIGKDAQRALARLDETTADKAASVRIRAALAVWQVGGETKYMPLLAKACADVDPGARQAAVAALTMIGPDARDALPALRPLLHDMDKMLRQDAAIAFWRVGGDAKETLAVLEPFLMDERPLRTAAIERLGTMGAAARALLPELVAIYREEESVATRRGIGATIRRVDAAVAAKLGIR